MRWNPFEIMQIPRLQMTIMDEIVLGLWFLIAIGVVLAVIAILLWLSIWWNHRVRKP